MREMGGEHSDLFQSRWYFKESRQLLTLYVDDIVLSGRASSQDSSWQQLQRHLTVEEPAPVHRILRALLTTVWLARLSRQIS